MQLTKEKAKELGRKFFEELPDEEFIKIEIVELCPRCKQASLIVKPCTILPRDHGHGSCTNCSYICPGWISAADGCPFRG